MTNDRSRGVSFVVPVFDGEKWLEECLNSILEQADGRPMEVLAIDDGSSDGSPAILERFAAEGNLRILPGSGQGAAAAINVGIRHAMYPIICQVDQDVVLKPGWMDHLSDRFSEPDIAAVQGRWVTASTNSILSRVSSLDLEQRYSRIGTGEVDHVCTGNSAYLSKALLEVELFDPSFGYGYDNDMSYRLTDAGYRLVFCPEAESHHRWPSRLAPYIRHQYGVAYGRLDLIAKHRNRIGGDQVSGLDMILHAAGMTASLVAALVAVALAATGRSWHTAALLSVFLMGALVIERLLVGLRVAWEERDPLALFFPAVHLVRDFAWASAGAVWLARRLAGQGRKPKFSMPRRD